MIFLNCLDCLVLIGDGAIITRSVKCASSCRGVEPGQSISGCYPDETRLVFYNGLDAI